MSKIFTRFSTNNFLKRPTFNSKEQFKWVLESILDWYDHDKNPHSNVQQKSFINSLRINNFKSIKYLHNIFLKDNVQLEIFFTYKDCKLAECLSTKFEKIELQKFYQIYTSRKWSSRITYYTDVLMSTSHFCRIVGFFFSLSPKNYFLKMISKWCNAVYRNSKWSCVSISFVAAACLTKGLNVWWEYAQLKLPLLLFPCNSISHQKCNLRILTLNGK